MRTLLHVRVLVPQSAAVSNKVSWARSCVVRKLEAVFVSVCIAMSSSGSSLPTVTPASTSVPSSSATSVVTVSGTDFQSAIQSAVQAELAKALAASLPGPSGVSAGKPLLYFVSLSCHPSSRTHTVRSPSPGPFSSSSSSSSSSLSLSLSLSLFFFPASSAHGTQSPLRRRLPFMVLLTLSP